MYSRRSSRRLAVIVMALSTLVPLASAVSAVPPAFPDPAHVPNGCFVSAAAYLARFHAAFPGEKGLPFTIAPPTYPGRHTVALITWRGEWWARDEHCGVFPLDRSVARYPDPSALKARVEMALMNQWQREIRKGRAQRAAPPTIEFTIGGADAVAQAAALLPLPSERFLVTAGGRSFAVLFFRPAAGWIAVYEPNAGTSRAECADANARGSVAALVRRLGLDVSDVRPDVGATATLVAATGSR